MKCSWCYCTAINLLKVANIDYIHMMIYNSKRKVQRNVNTFFPKLLIVEETSVLGDVCEKHLKYRFCSLMLKNQLPDVFFYFKKGFSSLIFFFWASAQHICSVLHN